MKFQLSVFSAQSKSENAQKTGTRALGNQVIRKGHMCIQNLGIMKGKNQFSIIVMVFGIEISNGLVYYVMF